MIQDRSPALNWIGRLGHKFATYLRNNRNLPKHSIVCSHSGFTLHLVKPDGTANSLSLSWSEITEVIAYKLDCYGTDLLCVALGGETNAIELNESMEGWAGLLDRLEEYLPGCQSKDDWYKVVVSPALQTNRTVIFSRERTNKANTSS